MKKVEKYIYLVIILVLVAVIASGITYIVMSNKNNDNNENIKENNSNESEVTLTEQELKEYLSYVPDDPNLTSMETNVNNNAYTYKYVTVTKMNKETLLGNILYKFIDGGEGAKVSLNIVEHLMAKMYNLKLDNYENSFDENGNWLNYVASYNGVCFTYEDGYFISNYCSSASNSLEIVESYQISKEEIIIYNYAVTYYSMFNQDQIFDLYTNKEYKSGLLDKNGTEDNWYLTDEKVEKYLKDNKNEFTKYKHTFKKNDTGYYWYSTEVVE